MELLPPASLPFLPGPSLCPLCHLRGRAGRWHVAAWGIQGRGPHAALVTQTLTASNVGSPSPPIGDGWGLPHFLLLLPSARPLGLAYPPVTGIRGIDWGWGGHPFAHSGRPWLDGRAPASSTPPPPDGCRGGTEAEAPSPPLAPLTVLLLLRGEMSSLSFT